MKPFASMTGRELSAFFARLTDQIAAALPADPSTGTAPLWVLVVQDSAATGTAHWVGNGDRPQVVGMLRQTADLLERGRDIPR